MLVLVVAERGADAFEAGAARARLPRRRGRDARVSAVPPTSSSFGGGRAAARAAAGARRQGRSRTARCCSRRWPTAGRAIGGPRRRRRRRSAPRGALDAARRATARSPGRRSTVDGRGRRRRSPSPTDVLDCGNSGTTHPRADAGCSRAGRSSSVLTGDESLRAAADGAGSSSRCAAMGAHVDGRADGTLRAARRPRRRRCVGAAPRARGGERAGEDRAASSPGCRPTAPPRSSSPRPSRDHTERMLAALGAPVTRVDERAVRVTAGAPGAVRARRARRSVVGRVLGRRGHDHARLRPRGRGRRAATRRASRSSTCCARMGAAIEIVHDRRAARRAGRRAAGPRRPAARHHGRGRRDPVGDRRDPGARGRGRVRRRRHRDPRRRRAAGEGERPHRHRRRAAHPPRRRGRGAAPTASWCGAGSRRPAALESHGDHRIAMAGAVAANAIEGETVVRGWRAVGELVPGVRRRPRHPHRAGPHGEPGCARDRDRRARRVGEVDGGARRGRRARAADARHRRDVPRGHAGRARGRRRPRRRRRVAAGGARGATSTLDDGAALLDGRDVQRRDPRARGHRRGVAGVGASRGARGARRPAAGVGGASTAAGVVEGRDIGTVVFPDAPVKVFITASDDERAAPSAARRGGGGARGRASTTCSTRSTAGTGPTRPSGARPGPRTPPPTRSSSTPATSPSTTWSPRSSPGPSAEVAADASTSSRACIVLGVFKVVFRVRVRRRGARPDAGRVHRRAVAPVDPRHPVRRVHHRPHGALPGQGRPVPNAAAVAGSSTRSARCRSSGAPPTAARCARSRPCSRPGEPVAVFPEGTRQHRARDRRAVRRAPRSSRSSSGVPIVPVGIGGSEQILPKGKLFPRIHRVAVSVGRADPAAGARRPRPACRGHASSPRSCSVELQRCFDDAERLAR